MPEQNRQLAAIMFTDIVGYTALMGKDEQKAFAILQKNRDIQKPLIEQHDGKWIKELGDGVLASFQTVSDAVTAAIKIHEACNTGNEFQLRIGIHLGEVIFENGDVFGDGVNIASRIQALALPGTTWISEVVFRNIENKKGINTDFVKEATLKNVQYPVKIYQLRSEKEIQNIIFSTQTIIERSIAVLPFVNMSGDPDNEYFCDGLSEELLNVLAKVESLKVASRTSSFLFRGKGTDITEIGNKLKVATVLEGSVRKAGNRLRITAQLINTADGYHLWSERYDRNMEDIFDIQDEISLAILNALKVKLLGDEKAEVLKRYTGNTEAYQLYLQGRYHYNKWAGPEGYKQAIEYYNKAIALEPKYALAYTGLAACYLNLWFFSSLSPEESLPHMKEATYRSLELDEKIAESHLSLARMKFWYEWDFAGAEKEFNKAIELNPNLAEAHEQFGLMLGILERKEEALSQSEKAIELDPFSLMINWGGGWTSWLINEHERTNRLAKKLIELDYSFFGGHRIIGTERWTTGNFDEAEKELEISAVQNPGPFALSWLGCFYAYIGQMEKANRILNEMEDLQRRQPVGNYYLAIVYAAVGKNDLAVELLEKACDEHEGILVFFKHHLKSFTRDFKKDPRVPGILKRIGLLPEGL
jgi:adenylate cyclase